MKLTHWTVLLVGLALVTSTGQASAHAVRAGESVLGHVAGAGAREDIDIDLAAGDEIQIVLKAKGGSGCAPAIEVLDPDGRTIASGADERKIKLTVVATETGTHRIRLTTDHASAPRFAMKVRGGARRSYTDASGALEIGAVAGSTVTVKVKAAAGTNASAAMADGSGQDVALSIAGSGRKIRARSGALASTGDYTIEFGPAGATAKVRVQAPAARGALELTMTPAAGGHGSYTPPVAQGDDDEEDDGAEDDGAGDDGSQGDGTQNDGTVADGTVGGGAGNGIVNPAPAPLTDHSYLTVLLAEREDAEIERVRVEMARHAGESAASAAAALAESVADPIAADIANAVAVCAEESADAAAIDAMVDLVAGQRRADQGRAALNILAADAPATSLGMNLSFQAGQAAAAAELASLNEAIAYALDGGLVAVVRGESDPAGLDAPAAPGAANEMIAGMAALDAAVLSGPVMARARALDGAAIAMADGLYAAYQAMLTENPLADPNVGQTQAAIALARAELEALSRQAFGVALELALVEMPRVTANEPYALDILAFGPADASEIDFDVESAEEVDVEAQAGGIRILSAGHAEARDYTVRARYAGAERVLNIRVEVEEEAPAEVDLRARVVDADGNPLVGARYELRASEESGIALNAAGRPCEGETDPDGFFLAERVIEGEYVLVISADGFAERLMPVTVAAGDFDPQDLGDIILD